MNNIIEYDVIMKEVELRFYGYTWEEYAFQLEGHSGIFIVYLGCLDSEGFVVVKDILYIGYHKRINELFDNGKIGSLKKQVDGSYRLFFSYADVLSETEGITLAKIMNNAIDYRKIKPVSRNNRIIKLICKGKCDLVPYEIRG